MNREQAARVADRYISRDGRLPGDPPGGGAAKAAGLTNERAAAIADIAAFIVAHDPRDMWGGTRAREAIDALETLIGCPPGRLRTTIGDERWQ